ncbi:hypothetical protein FRC17_001911, partial [Serendipita sp. 399]
TFAYNLNYASDKTDAGAPLSATVTVGSYSKVDNFGVSDRGWLWYSNTPNLGDPFAHSGTTSLLKSSDGTIGYLPITIDFTFPRQPDSDCTWYFVANPFRITTALGGGASGGGGATVAATSPSSGSSNTGTGTGTGTLTSLLSLGLPTQSVGSSHSPSSSALDDVSSGSSSSSGSNTSTTANQKVPIGAIIGGVVGGLILLVLFALLLLLLYRRKVKELMMKQDGGSRLLIRPIGGGGGGTGTIATTGADITTDGDSARRRGVSSMTTHSESFVGYPYSGVSPSFGGDTKSGNYLSEPMTTTTATSASPFVIPYRPDSSVVDESQYSADVEGAGAGGQRSRRRGRRGGGDGRRRQPSATLLEVASPIQTDAPPPAYSDVNGTVDGTNEHDGEEDEGEEGDYYYDDEEGDEDEGDYEGEETESHSYGLSRAGTLQGSTTTGSTSLPPSRHGVGVGGGVVLSPPPPPSSSKDLQRTRERIPLWASSATSTTSTTGVSFPPPSR